MWLLWSCWAGLLSGFDFCFRSNLTDATFNEYLSEDSFVEVDQGSGVFQSVQCATPIK